MIVIEIHPPDTRVKGQWFARVFGCPGCMTTARTKRAVVLSILRVHEQWLENAKDDKFITSTPQG